MPTYAPNSTLSVFCFSVNVIHREIQTATEFKYNMLIHSFIRLTDFYTTYRPRGILFIQYAFTFMYICTSPFGSYTHENKYHRKTHMFYTFFPTLPYGSAQFVMLRMWVPFKKLKNRQSYCISSELVRTWVNDWNELKLAFIVFRRTMTTISFLYMFLFSFSCDLHLRRQFYGIHFVQKQKRTQKIEKI